MRSAPIGRHLFGAFLAILAILADPEPAAASAAIEDLRSHALALVNDSRQKQGLPALKHDEALTQAAQRHAEDMAREGYFAHVSPRGETIRERYVAAGGVAGFVAENIAECTYCRPDRQRIEELHRGWVNSPGHRANILAHGLEGFGFGLAVEGSRLYAVQTFAGPGTTPGAEAAEETSPLDLASQLALAVDLVNVERQKAGAEPLKGSEGLSRALASKAGQLDLQRGLPPAESILQDLPAAQRDKLRSMAVFAAQCEGCGALANAADIRFFIGRWLESAEHRGMLLDPSRTHLGIAVSANGSGRKTALGLVAGS
jgi:uncharacterized protein YkwD